LEKLIYKHYLRNENNNSIYIDTLTSSYKSRQPTVTQSQSISSHYKQWTQSTNQY